MIISLKDSFKLIGVTIVCFCAVFVCTFFLNFYLDVLPLRDQVITEMLPLYEAQLAMAKMCCGITGGILALIACVIVIFYVKLYIDGHSSELGTLKALGYSANKLAFNFSVFGLSSFVGCALGYGFGHLAMPYIYDFLAIDGLQIEIHYHAPLLLFLVIMPTLFFACVAPIYAYTVLKKPTLAVIRKEKAVRKSRNSTTCGKIRGSLLKEISFKTVTSNKLLTFFVAFSCFCFAAMIQMGMSMESLTSATLGWLIFAIGVALALTSAFMALSSLIGNSSKTIAMMKTLGYSLKERVVAVFVGFVPFAVFGFALGTVYQYGLLSLMINLIFKDVAEVPDYTFNVSAFFITLALFILSYSGILTYYVSRLNKVSVKLVMTETV
ncbi:MAG: FtsX-like permease family protein [Corallococcus sp.]|nr:FtsX-like permease family protein [Corallococcus sp.]